MPEYILDLGTKKAAQAFKACGEFTRAYIEAAFWLLDEEIGDQPLSKLSADGWTRAIDDCKEFQEVAFYALDAAYAFDESYTEARAGHDFFLTRNHHGVGFWDRGLRDDIGKALTDHAHGFSETDLYRGDDGRLYFY
jgi:hypothetical protein